VSPSADVIGSDMVQQGLLLLALVSAALSVPFAVLSAVFLAGADDVANNAFASILGVLLVPASIFSVVAVLALLRGDPVEHTQVALVAPAVLAAIAGAFGGPRSLHRVEQYTGDVMTSRGYFRPGDPGYPQRPAPSRRHRLIELAKMVGLFLIVPTLVAVADVLA
jgi:hypothetical protein